MKTLFFKNKWESADACFIFINTISFSVNLISSSFGFLFKKKECLTNFFILFTKINPISIYRKPFSIERRHLSAFRLSNLRYKQPQSTNRQTETQYRNKHLTAKTLCFKKTFNISCKLKNCSLILYFF